MSAIGQPERTTQNRVIALFRDELQYRYLGDWRDRKGNSNIEVELLTAYLTRCGYTPAQIGKALDALRREADNHSRNLYGNNQAVYALLRYGVPVKIEAGKVTPQQSIQTAPGKLTVGGRTIGDAHAYGMLTVAEVVAKSSNVGTAKIALDLPAETLWDLYTKVGFGQAPRVAVGAVAGRLRPASTWRPIEQATIAYGYGVSVSLLQLARAYMVFARDGDVVPLSLVKLDAPPPSILVLQPQTAAAMRNMLEMAVGNGGTAPRARIDDYRVAGKTGTARKLRDGRYVSEYVASFAGFAPVSKPRLVVAVMIDEPDAGQFYGGQVAAPVFAEVVARSLRTLQVPPDATPSVLARNRTDTREGAL